MNTSSRHSIADYYIDLLVNLDPVSKRDLISKLSLTISDDVAEPCRSLLSLFGALKSDESAEGMIAAIQGSRVFNRIVENI